MIIMYLLFSFTVGGTERLVANICNQMETKNEEVHLYIINDLIDDNLTNTKLNNMINKLQTIIYTHINNKITNENKYVALTKEE